MKAFLGGLAMIAILAAAMIFAMDRASVGSATGFRDNQGVRIADH